MSQNWSASYENPPSVSYLTPWQDFTLGSCTVAISFAFTWILRLTYDRRAAVWDIASLSVLLLPWKAILSFFIQQLYHNASYLGVAGILSASILFLATPSGEHPPKKAVESVARGGRRASLFMKPLLFPCRTTHSRFFPTKHSFSYSYLYVGIPVGWRSHCGTVLSADGDCKREKRSKRPWTWFTVEAEDYLERGNHEDGLLGKLHSYLTSQGIPLDRYPHAYLITAPRFLGFSFNPVSFWYLYTDSKALGAMILEVNNTFDERRMYFLESSQTKAIPAEDVVRFNHNWKKDFHVSPFNSRDGSYSLRATDPFAESPINNWPVECNILLKSPLGEPKISARVFSADPPLEASRLSRLDTLLFVSRWWWVGFMTNPRILREARVLWVKKLQVYYRPEVFKSSIGRRETSEEAELELFFQSFLQHVVDHSNKILQMKYTPAAGPHRGLPLTLGVTEAGVNGSDVETTEIRVLTPAFYSHFIRPKKVMDAFESLCFCANEEEKMLDISDAEGFRVLLQHVKGVGSRKPALSRGWNRLSTLRRTGCLSFIPSLLVDTLTWGRLDLHTDPCLSEMDSLVLNGSLTGHNEQYLAATTTLLLANKLAFGWLPVLRFYGTMIWLSVVGVAAHGCRGGIWGPRAGWLGLVPLHTWALLLWHWSRW